MPKIVDCFTFNNEEMMLRFRIEELRDVVDVFVVVEATKTHSGQEKPLYLDEVLPFRGVRIERVLVEDMPDGPDAWAREKHQRRCISRGLEKLGLSDDDIVTVCDADEIPDPNLLQSLKQNGLKGVRSLVQQAYCYNICCRIMCEDYKGIWTHAKVADYASVKAIGDIDAIRFYPSDGLAGGGWHFSSFGDASFLQNKVRSYAHQEFNNPDVISGAEESVRTMRDPFLRPNRSVYVDPSTNQYLPRNWKMLDPADTKNIDVIMTTCTADTFFYGLAQRSINTLRSSNPGIEFRVVVVESCPTAQENGFIFPGCTVVQYKGDFNYNRALNIGVSHCTADYILQINNDVIFLDGSVKKLIEVMERVGMQSACPLEPNYHRRGVPDVDSVPYHRGNLVGKHLFGWCKCVRKRLLDKIGEYDERFLFYYQDNDYAAVIESHDVSHYLVTESHVAHEFGPSMRTLLGDRKNECTVDSRYVFLDKWGRQPDNVFYKGS